MLEDLNKGQKIFMVTLFVLTAISMLFGGFALYNLLTVEKPWTIGVVYASKIQANDTSVPIINIKIYENKNGNERKNENKLKQIIIHNPSTKDIQQLETFILQKNRFQQLQSVTVTIILKNILEFSMFDYMKIMKLQLIV